MNVAVKQLDEILSSVNSSSDVAGQLQLACKQPYVRFYLATQLSEDWPSFDVDEIEFTNYDYHRSMAGALLLNRQTVNIYQNIFMNSFVVLKTKRYQCKTLLEMLSKGESDILIALLKKDLQGLYPNITFDILNTV